LARPIAAPSANDRRYRTAIDTSGGSGEGMAFIGKDAINAGRGIGIVAASSHRVQLGIRQINGARGLGEELERFCAVYAVEW
jgi:hypothetical protein